MADNAPAANASSPPAAGFQPPILALRAHRATVERDGERDPLVVALERENGLVSRHQIGVLPPSHPDFEASLRLIERWVKFLVWSRGGWRLHVGAAAPGARTAADRIRSVYSPDGERAFEVSLLGRVYGRAFEVVAVEPAEVPEDEAATMVAGGHFDGCRIGIDLGASDYKIAAVVDGEPVFSAELPWDPRVAGDPAYHLEHIRAGLQQAASHLPRVDAIGVSSAGIYIDDKVKVASLFRSVEPQAFADSVERMFIDIGNEWGVPIRVINDGDVTALAGALSLRAHGVLGIAMGSSEAGGYVDPSGHITGWLNELAFAPVDLDPAAAVEEWSGDHGVGALYFSQQAVARLADAAGLEVDPHSPLPERLQEVQAMAATGDERAGAIFATIGTYLGFTIPWYLEHYEFEHVLILGRVTSGEGGEILAARARAVLTGEFPEIAERVSLHMPDENSRRVRQAVVAASLPESSAAG